MEDCLKRTLDRKEADRGGEAAKGRGGGSKKVAWLTKLFTWGESFRNGRRKDAKKKRRQSRGKSLSVPIMPSATKGSGRVLFEERRKSIKKKRESSARGQRKEAQ